MLTAKQQEILKVLQAGRRIDEDAQLQALIKSGHVTERDGIYELTDDGLKQARVAQSFGEAIADTLMPGAGTKTPS